MDNKYRIIVLCMIFVVLGGMIFDMNHRASKFEQQKQQLKVQYSHTLDSENETAQKIAQKTGTSEMEFLQMAQGVRNDFLSAQKMQNLSKLSGDIEYTPDNHKQSDSSVSSTHGKIVPEKFIFEKYGISCYLSSILPKYKGQDTLGNYYYFIPAKMGEDVLGILTKTSGNNQFEWIKVLKYERMTKPNVRLIAFTSKTLKIYFSQKNGIGAYPISVKPDGTVLKNPYEPIYSTNLAPENYKFKIFKKFSYNNNDYAIVSFINFSSQNKTDSDIEELYIYKIKNQNLVRQYFLFDRKIPSNSVRYPELEFDVSIDSGYISIFATAPPDINFSGYSNAMKFKVDILDSNMKMLNSEAPSAVSPGIFVVSEEN